MTQHRFENLVVVVVGGGTGIGEATAKTFARDGATVVIGGRRDDKLKSVVEAFGSDDCDRHSAGSIHARTIDVADDSSVKAFFDGINADQPTIDVMINCAGINVVDRALHNMDPADWTRVMNINANGAFRCLHAVAADMVRRGGGTIVNVSSIAGKRALELAGVVYCSSKFAMTALGTAAANELKDHGVRVTNVYPGEVNTPILDARPNPVSDAHRAQILQPDDVADMIAAIVALPPRAHVPEIVIKPTTQHWL